jgi:hypothetical protein
VDAIFRYWEDAMMAFDSEDGVILPPAHKPKTLMDSVAVRIVFARSLALSHVPVAPDRKLMRIGDALGNQQKKKKKTVLVVGRDCSDDFENCHGSAGAHPYHLPGAEHQAQHRRHLAPDLRGTLATHALTHDTPHMHTYRTHDTR